MQRHRAGGFPEKYFENEPKKKITPHFFQRRHSAPNLSPPTTYNQKLAGELPVKESDQMRMVEHGEYAFLLATQLDPSYLVVHNSRDSASVATHFHCYAVKKDFMMENQGKHHSFPLFERKSEKTLFDSAIQQTPARLDKVSWPGCCYRLTVPLQKDSNAYLSVANYIEQFQKEILEKKQHCTFSFLTNQREGAIEFYIGFRKCIDRKDCIEPNMMNNALAKQNNLQSPYIGALEFAGIHNMKNEEEFKRYQALYRKDPEAASQLFSEIQSRFLEFTRPSAEDIVYFERCLLETLRRCNDISMQQASEAPKSMRPPG